jgi:DNA-binding response OmpR family regulator
MKRTAVVVAWDRTTRFFLSSSLNSLRWWVGEASSASGACALLTTFRVDVVLIDLLHMDTGEVLDVCRCFRTDEEEAKTKIVVLASEDEENTTILDGLHHIADAVYQKPYGPQAMLDWLSATFPNY